MKSGNFNECIYYGYSQVGSIKLSFCQILPGLGVCMPSISIIRCGVEPYILIGNCHVMATKQFHCIEIKLTFFRKLLFPYTPPTNLLFSFRLTKTWRSQKVICVESSIDISNEWKHSFLSKSEDIRWNALKTGTMFCVGCKKQMSDFLKCKYQNTQPLNNLVKMPTYNRIISEIQENIWADQQDFDRAIAVNNLSIFPFLYKQYITCG